MARRRNPSQQLFVVVLALAVALLAQVVRAQPVATTPQSIPAAIAPNLNAAGLPVVNENDPDYEPALEALKADPLRTVEWAGDSYSLNKYADCPGEVVQGPRPNVSYKPRAAAASVTFSSTLTNYCDLLGTIEHRVELQIQNARGKPFKRVAGPVVYVTGLREILMNYGMSYWRYHRVTVPLSAVPNACRGVKSDRRSAVRMRAAITSVFTPNREQTFAHQEFSGRSDTVAHAKQLHLGPKRRACK